MWPGCEGLPDAAGGAARRRGCSFPDLPLHPQAACQFVTVRHQFIEREKVCRGVCRLAAHAPAAVSGHGVKPDRHLLRGLDLGKVPDGTGKHLLHGIFGVFRMAQTFMLNE